MKIKYLIILIFVTSIFNLKAQNAASNFTLLSVISPESYFSGCWGWYQPNKNKEYAIAGSFSGVYWVDVTIPTTPTISAFRAGNPSNWREIKTYQNYCYVSTENTGTYSFQIFDMQYLPDSVHKVYDSDALFKKGHALWIDGNKLYVSGITYSTGATSSMEVFSLATPTAPVLIRKLSQDAPFISYVHDTYARNDTVFASCGWQGLYVFKLTSSNTFSALGSLTSYTASGYNHSSALTPNGQTLVFADEVPASLPIKVANVSNFSNIQILATTNQFPQSTPHNPFIVSNSLCFMSSYRDGLQLFDISNPSLPAVVGYFDTYPAGGGNNNNWSGSDYDGNWGAYPYFPSKNILAVDRNNGIFMLKTHLYQNPIPSFSLPSNICEGASFSVVNTSSASNSYTWNFPGGTPINTIAINPTVSYPSSGIYSITLIASNANGLATLTQTISVNVKPVLTINTPTSCSGSPAALVANGASSYTWSTGANTNTIIESPLVTTIYTVVGSNGICTSINTSTIFVTPNPTVSVINQTICIGNAATLTASGANSYSWSTGFNGNPLSITPTLATTYTVEGTSAGCSDTKTVSVIVFSGPIIAVSAATICSSDSAILVATGATSYTWSTGSNSSTISASPQATSIYSVIGTNGICPTTQTAVIVVNPTPTLSVNDQTICPNGTATITAGGASTYSWNTGFSGNPLIVSPVTITIYTVTGTAIGCVDTKTVSVNVGSSVGINITSNSVALCIGDSAILTASGATSYTWSNGANGPSTVVTPSATATYTVIGNSGLCSGVNSISLSVSALPTPASAGNNQTICISTGSAGVNGNVPIVGAGNWSALVGSGTFSNSNSPVNQVIGLQVGLNILEWNITNGACNSSSTLSILADQIPTTASPISSQTICSGTSATLVANVPTIGNGNWTLISGLGIINSPTSPSTTINGLGAGINGFQWTISNGICAPSTATTSVVNNNTFAITALSTSSIICLGSTVNLNGFGASTYTWSNGSVNPIISVSPTITTTYTLVGISGPCSSSAAVTQVVSLCTELNQLNKTYSNLLVYPNPAQDHVAIEYPNTLFNYALYNNLGQLINQTKNNQNIAALSLTQLPKGIYFIEVEIGVEKIRKKLIVE